MRPRPKRLVAWNQSVAQCVMASGSGLQIGAAVPLGPEALRVNVQTLPLGLVSQTLLVFAKVSLLSLLFECIMLDMAVLRVWEAPVFFRGLGEALL